MKLPTEIGWHCNLTYTFSEVVRNMISGTIVQMISGFLSSVLAFSSSRTLLCQYYVLHGDTLRLQRVYFIVFPSQQSSPLKIYVFIFNKISMGNYFV